MPLHIDAAYNIAVSVNLRQSHVVCSLYAYTQCVISAHKFDRNEQQFGIDRATKSIRKWRRVDFQ